jgi:hypothetical protein
MFKLSNRDYYSARIATERALADEAETAAIAALHNELANRYAALLAELDEQEQRPAPTPRRAANG